MIVTKEMQTASYDQCEIRKIVQLRMFSEDLTYHAGEFEILKLTRSYITYKTDTYGYTFKSRLRGFDSNTGMLYVDGEAGHELIDTI